jgi:aspartyl protease family protein
MKLTRLSLCALLAASFLLTALWAGPARAFEDLHVLALFRDRVIVMVDGERRNLRQGETSPEGLKLVSADSEIAVFDYHGQRVERRLGSRVLPATGDPVAARQVQIFRDRSGMFRTVGSINGLPVNFLVDTGATSLAMNANEARRLGIDYRLSGEPAYVATASDVRRAYQVKLDRVRVGDIELLGVTAVVLDGSMPDEVLLGMSFLGRLELINRDDRLILKRRY